MPSIRTWSVRSSVLLLLAGAVLLPSHSTRADEAERPDAPERPTVAERLARKTDVDFERTPLHEALETLSDAAGAAIELDGDGLKAAGYTRNMPQTLSVDARSVAGVLSRIVRGYPRMIFVIDEPGNRVVVTTAGFRDRFVKEEPGTGALHSLIGLEELDAEIADIRARLRAGVANIRSFRTSAPSIARSASELRALMQVARVHPDFDASNAARDVARAGDEFAAAVGARNLERARGALKSIDESLANPPNRAAETKVTPPKLVAYMGRFERALRRISAASRADSIDDGTRETLERDAAVVSAYATLVADFEDDDEFAEHATGLSKAAARLRRAVQDGQPFAGELPLVTQSCTKCHAAFR